MSSDWWSKRIAPQRAPLPPLPPIPQPGQQQPPQQPAPFQQAPAGPEGESVQDHVVGEGKDRTVAWSGGMAAKTEVGNCPSCGSNLYFSRANVGPSQAARCYSCGYNSRFPQQGAGPA